MKIAAILEYYPNFNPFFRTSEKSYSSFFNNHSSKFLNFFTNKKIIKPVHCRIISDPNDKSIISLSQNTPHLILNLCHKIKEY